MLVGLLVGLLVGGGGVGLTWFLLSPSEEEEADAAATDAAAACEVVLRTETVVADDDALTGLHRWGGAMSLAMAAAEADPAYQDLSDKIEAPYKLYQRFMVEGPEFDDAIQTARTACENR